MRLSTLRFNVSLLGCFLGGALLFCLTLPLVQFFSGQAKIDVFSKQSIDFKLQAVRQAGSNRIIILSGSNGWYSIDSDQIAKALHRPVVNAAVHFGLLQFMMEEITPLIGEGDVVLMPIEYEHYFQPQSMGETEACVRVFNDFPPSWSLDWYKALNACPNGWRKFITAFKNIMKRTPSNSQDITLSLEPSGDMRGNTKAAATWSGGWKLNSSDEIDHITQPRMEKAIAKMQKRGARVVITFPVQPLESIKNEAALERWQELIHMWGEKQGVPVVSTPQEHLFPDTCFFDSPCHLHRGCSPKNTQRYIKALQSLGI